MTVDLVREFLLTLHEPAAAVAPDGRFEVVNDAFRRVLRTYGRADAPRVHDAVSEAPGTVDDFLKRAGSTRPAVQGRLTLRNGGREDRFVCYGSLLRPAADGRPALILLRFYRSKEAVQRFQLLGRKIDELNAEIQRRREVEAELRDVQRTLEERVTERTAELERANLDLVRSNEALEEFAYVASHDLREPLRKITVFCGLLLQEARDDLAEEHRSLLGRVTKAAERMDRLVESLLEYSRLSTTTEPFTPVDLNRVVREVLGDLEVLVDQTGAEVDVADLPELDADETQMHRLFQNLISNSLKFGKPGEPPHVRITSSASATNETGRVDHVIELSDNGIGFEEEFAEQIFDPFRRLHPHHEVEGTGIGLAVCRKIVERHGGTIAARGEPGKGATFRIVLPANGGMEA